MNCIECNGKTKVIDSRTHVNQRCRKRVCKDCGKCFWTVERVLSQSELCKLLYQEIQTREELKTKHARKNNNV